MPRSLRRAAAAVPLLVVLTGCGGGSPEATPTPSSASPPPSLTPSPSPTPTFDQSTPVTAYRAYYAAVIKAARTANFHSPDLPATATGNALKAIAENLRRLSMRGQTLRGTIKINPTLGPVNGDSATVYDCQDGSGWLVYDRTGQPVATGTPRNDRVVALLVRVGGVWKVSDIPPDQFVKGGC